MRVRRDEFLWFLWETHSGWWKVEGNSKFVERLEYWTMMPEDLLAEIRFQLPKDDYVYVFSDAHPRSSLLKKHDVRHLPIASREDLNTFLVPAGTGGWLLCIAPDFEELCLLDPVILFTIDYC